MGPKVHLAIDSTETPARRRRLLPTTSTQRHVSGCQLPQQLRDHAHRQRAAGVPQHHPPQRLEVRVLLQAEAARAGHLNQRSLALEQAPGKGRVGRWEGVN